MHADNSNDKKNTLKIRMHSSHQRHLVNWQDECQTVKASSRAPNILQQGACVPTRFFAAGAKAGTFFCSDFRVANQELLTLKKTQSTDFNS